MTARDRLFGPAYSPDGAPAAVVYNIRTAHALSNVAARVRLDAPFEFGSDYDGSPYWRGWPAPAWGLIRDTIPRSTS